MKCIRQPVFYSASLAAPMTFVVDPRFALRDVSPCPNVRQTFGQGIDIAFDLVDALDRLCQEIRRDSSPPDPLANQKVEDPFQQGRMFGARRVAKVRNAANVPQKLHALGVGQLVADIRDHRQRLERENIIGVARAGQPFVRSGEFKTADQTLGRAELQLVIAPVQLAHRGKPVGFDGLDHLVVQRPRLAGHAERAVLDMPPGAACDLRQFLRMQRPHPTTVEFRRR